jgi:hypothetical protein
MPAAIGNKDQSVRREQFFEMLLNFPHRKQTVAMILNAAPNLRRALYDVPAAEIAPKKFVHLLRN